MGGFCCKKAILLALTWLVLDWQLVEVWPGQGFGLTTLEQVSYGKNKVVKWVVQPEGNSVTARPFAGLPGLALSGCHPF
jgi:hypothetical protein